MGCWDDSRRETLPSVLPRNKIDDPVLLLPGLESPSPRWRLTEMMKEGWRQVKPAI